MITSTSATVLSVPPNENQEIIDFLRRLASMLTGGRNAEMLLEAAEAIEALAQRALAAERLYEAQQEDHARNLELREAATAIDHSIAIVPVESLQLARTQFDFLAAGFARNGDVISQTICQIGACAIDKALSGNEPARN
jgi:hypothetical protein